MSTCPIALRVRECAESVAARQRHALHLDIASRGVAIETKVDSAAFARDRCFTVHDHSTQTVDAPRRERLSHYCVRATRIHADEFAARCLGFPAYGVLSTHDTEIPHAAARIRRTRRIAPDSDSEWSTADAS